MSASFFLKLHNLLHSNTVSLTGVEVALQGFLAGKELTIKMQNLFEHNIIFFFCAQFSRNRANSCLEINALRFHIIFVSEKVCWAP